MHACVCIHACMYACTCARVYVCSCLLSLLSLLLLLLLLLSSSWWLLLFLFLFLFLSRLLCGPAGASSLRPLGQSDEFLRSVTKQRKIDQLESQKSALEGQLARETHGDCVRDCRSKLTCSLASASSLSFLSLSLSQHRDRSISRIIPMHFVMWKCRSSILPQEPAGEQSRL